MSVHAVVSRRSVAPALLIAATFVLTFILRYPSFFEPRWYGDEGIFASVAASLRHGHMLYSGAWDNKPPLIYFTYAGIQSVAGTGELPLHIAATISVLATQAAVVAVAVLLYGRWRAVVAGVVFALLLGTPVLEGNLALTETFMILPSSLAALLFVWSEQRRAGGATEASPGVLIAIGALIGIAAAYKQVAVFDGLAIAVMVRFTHERALRSLGAMAAGFALPQGALALLFLAAGAFGAYWYAIVGSLGMYARLAPSIGVVRRVEEIVPPLLVLALLTYRHRRHGPIDLRLFPLVWLSFAFAGVIASTFPFPHYMQQAAPALALVVAAVPSPRIAMRDLRATAVIGVAAVLVALAVQAQFAHALNHRKQLSPHWYYTAFIDRQSGSLSHAQYDARFDGSVDSLASLGGTIHEDDGGDTVFFWSERAWLYAQADLTNPTRYYTSVLGTRVPGARAEIMRELAERPPDYVAFSDGAYRPFPQLQTFVDHRYTLIATRENDWLLYRLSSARGRLTPLDAADVETATH